MPRPRRTIKDNKEDNLMSDLSTNMSSNSLKMNSGQGGTEIEQQDKLSLAMGVSTTDFLPACSEGNKGFITSTPTSALTSSIKALEKRIPGLECEQLMKEIKCKSSNKVNDQPKYFILKDISQLPSCLLQRKNTTLVIMLVGTLSNLVMM